MLMLSLGTNTKILKNVQTIFPINIHFLYILGLSILCRFS